MIKIEVIDGKAVISKEALLYSIESIMESMMDAPEVLEDTTREHLAELFLLMGVLAEVIAVDEKNEDNDYPFLGTSWEIRKKRHGL